ncbi:hypothetical protein RDV78_03895 [Bacillota bacterium LX-D]|nr:hypothetical protein [Bacillota bacterium LX-D]
MACSCCGSARKNLAVKPTTIVINYVIKSASEMQSKNKNQSDNNGTMKK